RLLGQRGIVAAEIALALVLLTGAQLFAETIVRLTSQPLGFQPEGLAVVTTTFTGSMVSGSVALREAQSRHQVGQLPGGAEAMRKIIATALRHTAADRAVRVAERIAALPGVSGVAGSTAMPFFGNPSRVPVVMEQRPNTERHDALQHWVTDDYFDVMDMRLS